MTFRAAALLLPLTLFPVAAGPPGSRIPRRPAPASLEVLPSRLSLTVATGAGETRVTVARGEAPSEPRRRVAVRAGSRPQVRWHAANTHTRLPIRNVVVHFLITRQEAPGAPVPTGPRKGSLVDTVLGTDLSARAGIGGTCSTPVPEPGSYLVQLELLDPQGVRRHHALLELDVE